MYLFTNVLGVFVFDENLEVVGKILFENLEDYRNKEKSIEKIKKQYENIKEPDEEKFRKMLMYFKNFQFFNDFYNKNIQITKLDVKNSVSNDTLLIQAIKSIDELDKAINLLVKRLREWYDLYNPEFSRSVADHESFIESILENEKIALLKKIGVEIEDSIGADFNRENLEPIKNLAQKIHDLYILRKRHLEYISSLMDQYCSNLKAVCEVMIAAKLLEHAGSLKRLSEMPASTIQILGAEKALFRHMKTGAKPPRHGVIVSHPLIARATEKMHGKVARTLADKISIAAKVDYFHGKFIGSKLREELEEKFKDTK